MYTSVKIPVLKFNVCLIFIVMGNKKSSQEHKFYGRFGIVK